MTIFILWTAEKDKEGCPLNDANMHVIHIRCTESCCKCELNYCSSFIGKGKTMEFVS
jgi:hypothetical protein